MKTAVNFLIIFLEKVLVLLKKLADQSAIKLQVEPTKEPAPATKELLPRRELFYTDFSQQSIHLQSLLKKAIDDYEKQRQLVQKTGKGIAIPPYIGVN